MYVIKIPNISATTLRGSAVLETSARVGSVSLDPRIVREIGKRLQAALGPPPAELPSELASLVAAIGTQTRDA